jgi:hypothetical protein
MNPYNKNAQTLYSAWAQLRLFPDWHVAIIRPNQYFCTVKFFGCLGVGVLLCSPHFKAV